MDQKLPYTISEGHFGNNTKKSEDGGTGSMEEGQGRLESQSDQGQGQVGSSEMFKSVGPDEMGKSLLVEELQSIEPERQLVKTFKAPPPKVEISEVFNLKELLENIDKCGRYRYIVVNATADKASVLIKTQNALFDVLKLCDAVSLIVQNFQSGASNILEKLRVACLYLQDGFPDFAMADIESTSKDVAMMRERCGKTLEKVPGDNLPSMDAYVSNDLEERRSGLPEGMMHDRFVASDVMQRSTEGIEEGSKQLNQFGELADADRAKELTDIAAAVEQQLTCSRLPPGTTEEGTMNTNDDEEDSWVNVSIEEVVKMMAEDELKRHYYAIALMLRAVNCVWIEVKDRYIIIVYKYLGYKEHLTITNAKDRESKSSDAENSPISVAERQVPDPDVLDKIDSYMRAKLTAVIVEIVKELYNNIRKLIKDALDLTEKWYQECKTLVEPVMKFNLEKTREMTKEEQEKFWQTCDPEFANKAEAYLERWRQLHEHCDSHRKDIRKLRQTIEGYYIDNPYPREAVKASWKLAAKEQERRIRNVVEEWRSYMPSAEVDGAE